MSNCGGKGYIETVPGGYVNCVGCPECPPATTLGGIPLTPETVSALLAAVASTPVKVRCSTILGASEWTYEDSYRPWDADSGKCATCGARPNVRCRLCGREACLRHDSHDCQRCYRNVEVSRQAQDGATGFRGIDMTSVRPCGGRLINGKCEFCDVTTIEGIDQG